MKINNLEITRARDNLNDLTFFFDSEDFSDLFKCVEFIENLKESFENGDIKRDELIKGVFKNAREIYGDEVYEAARAQIILTDLLNS